MAEILKIPKYPCPFCKKNEATQLCDFIIGYNWTSMKDDKGRMIGSHRQTCDNAICKECAVKVVGYEFCPSCNKLHQYVIKNHDRRKNKYLIDLAMGRLEIDE